MARSLRAAAGSRSRARYTLSSASLTPRDSNNAATSLPLTVSASADLLATSTSMTEVTTPLACVRFMPMATTGHKSVLFSLVTQAIIAAAVLAARFNLFSLPTTEKPAVTTARSPVWHWQKLAGCGGRKSQKRCSMSYSRAFPGEFGPSFLGFTTIGILFRRRRRHVMEGRHVDHRGRPSGIERFPGLSLYRCQH